MEKSVNVIDNKGSFQEDVKLKKAVQTKRGSYSIDKLLGEGGYGFVYLVTSKENKQKYAMKIERETRDKKCPKLKMEIMILKNLASIDRPKSHFVKMYDRWPNLFDLRKKCRNLEFSESTSFNVGIQCLESIEDLHKLNFIHRDIKPTNFAIGVEDKNNIIYLIDFGLARYILNGEGNLKTPREMCRFKGTIRYASLATHKGIENGRKDDVEAWIYMFIEFLPRYHLPWSTLNRLNDVLKKKCMFRKEWSRLFNNSNLSYANKVDYNYIYGIVKNVAQDNNIDLTKPLDWTIKKTQ